MFASSNFMMVQAIALVVSLIVMYDATGVRRETGEQAKLLNLILKDFKLNEGKETKFRHFKELVGHTPIQVATGMILGILIPFLYRGTI